MTFEELNQNKLGKSDYLWRYFNIHGFLNLITKKILVFSRLDIFPDPFEGVTSRLIKEKYLAKLIPNKEKLNPKLTTKLREQILQEKEAFEQRYDPEVMIQQKTQFVNCWFKGNRESMAMWNIYSTNTGVSIKIDGRVLIDNLKKLIELQPFLHPKFKFICGSVKYFKLNPVDIQQKVSGIYSAFKKDESFEYENEYRLLIVTPYSELEKNPYIIEFQVTETFFENTEVICHPEMPEWQFENINHLCKNVKFNNVRKSEIELK